MPCKNKLDVLYFVVEVLRGCYGLSKNRSYLRIKTTMIVRQVSVVLTFAGPGVATLGSTKVGETDTRQPPVCKARW